MAIDRRGVGRLLFVLASVQTFFPSHGQITKKPETG
jgi:hypothetical protein